MYKKKIIENDKEDRVFNFASFSWTGASYQIELEIHEFSPLLLRW